MKIFMFMTCKNLQHDSLWVRLFSFLTGSIKSTLGNRVKQTTYLKLKKKKLLLSEATLLLIRNLKKQINESI